jgi:hypothetical protein
MSDTLRLFCWTLPVLVSGALSLGCLRVPQQSATLETVKDVQVSSALLQLRAYETGRLASSIIERAADSIAAVSRDPGVRLRSLQWKVASVPLVQEASLHDEPLVAVVDLWALALQQSEYFETGDGGNAFGPFQEIALAAARQVVFETRRTFVRSVRSGEVPPEAVDAVPAWASSHPIRGDEMHRESLLSSDWNALGIEESSLPGTVASLNQTLVGITQRLGYVNEGLLKRVRWQGELMAGTVLLGPRTDSLLSSLQTTSAAIGTTLSDAPADLHRVRELVAHDLREQQTAAFAALDRQRVATLAALGDERLAAFAALRAERVATLAAVDSMTQRSIERFDAVATPMLRWLVAAVGVLVTVFAIGVLALVRALYRRSAKGTGWLHNTEQEGTI